MIYEMTGIVHWTSGWSVSDWMLEGVAILFVDMLQQSIVNVRTYL